MKIAFLTTLLAMPLIAHADAAPDIQVQDHGGGNYHLTLRSATITDPSLGQQALLPTAMKLCAGKLPQFGHFKYDQQKQFGKDGKIDPSHTTFVLDQDVACVISGTPAPALAEGGGPEGNYTPNQSETDRLLAVTRKYFDAKDGDDPITTYALLDKGLKEQVPFREWVEQSDHFHQKAGALVNRKLLAITWSKDPAGAPEPGIYTTVDYIAHFQDVDVQCGYLAWYEEPDGSFLLKHEEMGFMTKDDEKNMTPQSIAAAKQQLGCRGE